MTVKLEFKLALALVLAASLPAAAADLAILRNGNSIRHERRQVLGAVTRLYLSSASSGYLEIPTDQIERFEVDTAPPPTPVRSEPRLTEPANPLLAASTPAQAKYPAAPQFLDQASLGKVVSGAGARHQLDPDFISSVIRAESGFNTRAVSKKGAQGLMQLMPGTAANLGIANPFDPNANVEGGTKYLRELLEKYNYDVVKALAAYNAGSRRVDKYHGMPPYYETQAYVARIIRDFNRQKLAKNPALAQKQPVRAARSASRSAARSKTSTVTRTKPGGAAVAKSLPEGPQTASR